MPQKKKSATKKAGKTKQGVTTKAKWEKEAKAVKAIQVAFDVGEEVQYHIRREALDMGMNPSDRARQLLGLAVNKRPVRPRLSISLTQEDFHCLAKTFELSADDKVSIKHRAAEILIAHVRAHYPGTDNDSGPSD